jgi:hypothetical protein
MVCCGIAGWGNTRSVDDKTKTFDRDGNYIGPVDDDDKEDEEKQRLSSARAKSFLSSINSSSSYSLLLSFIDRENHHDQPAGSVADVNDAEPMSSVTRLDDDIRNGEDDVAGSLLKRTHKEAIHTKVIRSSLSTMNPSQPRTFLAGLSQICVPVNKQGTATDDYSHHDIHSQFDEKIGDLDQDEGSNDGLDYLGDFEHEDKGGNDFEEENYNWDAMMDEFILDDIDDEYDEEAADHRHNESDGNNGYYSSEIDMGMEGSDEDDDLGYTISNSSAENYI